MKVSEPVRSSASVVGTIGGCSRWRCSPPLGHDAVEDRRHVARRSDGAGGVPAQFSGSRLRVEVLLQRAARRDAEVVAEQVVDLGAVLEVVAVADREEADVARQRDVVGAVQR